MFENSCFAKAPAVNKKRIAWRWTVLILLLIASGAAGFLIGQNLSGSKYQAEKELNYWLNLSDLDGLGAMDGTIYVTGHKNPDADAVCSSIFIRQIIVCGENRNDRCR